MSGSHSTAQQLLAVPRRSTSAAIACRRSFHQQSGRVPITFMPSTIQRTDPR